jgi:hypothetical protein
MRPPSVLVLVVSLLGVLSACARQTKTSQTAVPTLPDLSFCEVVAKPADFDGKIIRLHAVFQFGLHGPTVGDRSCASVDNITWANLSPEKWAELERAAPAGAVDLVAVGKFARNVGSGDTDLWKDRAPFQFEVLSVEKITPRS